MNKKIFFLASAFFLTGLVSGQELVAKVTVIATRIGTTVEKRTFTTLQTQLNNLLNNRKWTDQNFKANERIECNFILNLDRQVETNIFGGTLTVQAARPVYNSSYKSPLVNWQDNDVVFKYIEYQPVEFNENRIGGSDGVASNLTAVFAYYVYTILGMDFDSFSAGAGDPYFKKAQFIVNNAPQARNIAGWTQFDGLRNRWWLSENLLNTRNALFHDAIYQYYRSSLDMFYEDEQEARNQMLNTLNTLFTFNSSFPNTMVLQFFMQSKSDELIEVFRKATPDQKSRVVEILSKIDLTNASKYREQLK
jgi:Domain of unknown function (DUF4835)